VPPHPRPGREAAFVDYVLRRTSLTDPGEAQIVRFSSVLTNGIGVPATIRHWHDDRLFVREEQRGSLNILQGRRDSIAGADKRGGGRSLGTGQRCTPM